MRNPTEKATPRVNPETRAARGFPIESAPETTILTFPPFRASWENPRLALYAKAGGIFHRQPAMTGGCHV